MEAVNRIRASYAEIKAKSFSEIEFAKGALAESQGFIDRQLEEKFARFNSSLNRNR